MPRSRRRKGLPCRKDREQTQKRAQAAAMKAKLHRHILEVAHDAVMRDLHAQELRVLAAAKKAVLDAL